jgi:hypothetical protein
MQRPNVNYDPATQNRWKSSIRCGTLAATPPRPAPASSILLGRVFELAFGLEHNSLRRIGALSTSGPTPLLLTLSPLVYACLWCTVMLHCGWVRAPGPPQLELRPVAARKHDARRRAHCGKLEKPAGGVPERSKGKRRTPRRPWSKRSPRTRTPSVIVHEPRRLFRQGSWRTQLALRRAGLAVPRPCNFTQRRYPFLKALRAFSVVLRSCLPPCRWVRWPRQRPLSLCPTRRSRSSLRACTPAARSAGHTPCVRVRFIHLRSC